MNKLMERVFNGITMPQFYKYGSILFSFGIIGAGINTKMQWLTLNIGGKISMISSFFFQCLFLTLFISLFIQTKQQKSVILENPEVENWLKKLQNQDNNEKGGSKNEQKDNINN